MDRADYCFCVRGVSHSLSLSYPLVLYNNVERSLLVISSSYYTLITSNWIYFIDSGNIGNIRSRESNRSTDRTKHNIRDGGYSRGFNLVQSLIQQNSDRKVNFRPDTLPSPHSKRLVERYDTSRGRGCVCTHVGACSQRTHARRGLLDRSHADKNCIMGLIGLRGPA